jgi:peptidoglycan hydrolase-like protein with peptidoglycan-binding domain
MRVRASGWGKVAAVIAAVAVLAACQGFPDLGFELRRTSTSPDTSATKAPANGPGPAEANVEAVILDQPAVRRLQARLDALGFAPGPTDGVLGRRTTEAIKRYQTAHRLPATGEVSPDFLKHLEATAANSEAVARSRAGLGPEDLPTYRPGTTFIYSNGDVERVAGAEASAVEWIRGDGAAYTAHRNFMMPWTYWASNGERGTTTVSGAGDALWPLREGTEVQFSVNVTVQRTDDAGSTEQRVERWRCRNDGQREITVPAGTFATLAFVCTREAKLSTPELVRTWYYAKTVRHFVRFVESDPERHTTRTVELVAVRPGAPSWPPIVRAALARAVLQALEAAESESRMPWSSSGVVTRVTIEAKSPFSGDDGKTCRHFVQTWSENGYRWHYPAIACKNPDSGKWEIPGLESDAASSLATSDTGPDTRGQSNVKRHRRDVPDAKAKPAAPTL